MNVSEAVAARRSVRSFTDQPVPVETVRELVYAASRAPSGGNLQPWHVDIVTGAALDRLKAIMQGKLANGEVEAAEYPIYPPKLEGAYRDRRFAIGEEMYGHLGIPREDKAARLAWFRNNFAFFGAPAALFVTVDRGMGPPQWSDMGMFLQSFMLLAQERGLATCAQECWALFPETVRAFLGTPQGRMLFCGMAIGHEDEEAAVNRLKSNRATHEEWLTIHK